jgi:AcrR family transcriptional regulator
VATEVAEGQGRPRRLTQPERSAATRQALLDSTIECLIELGYDHSTTGEISERAGLSRGAHLHHFGTRAALLAAAAESLAERGGEDLRRRVSKLPQGEARVTAALEMVWKLFTGALFQAVLELAVHARTDPELRAALEPVERGINRDAIPWLRTAFGFQSDDSSADERIAVVTGAIRGIALMPVLDPDVDIARLWKRSRPHLVTLFAS